MWKQRLESLIKGLRRDLSRVEALLQGRLVKEYHRGELERKYKISENGLKHVSEDLKQRVTAKATKIQRYQNRNKQFQQNRLFETAQRKFYEKLSGVKNHCEPIPDEERAKQFWGNIWGEEATHRRDADWLKKLKEEVKVTQQADMSITVHKVSQFLRRAPSWKAPGPDLVQGFWLKNFTSLHRRIANKLQSCLDNGNMPEWMTKGRTVLLMKDPEKGATAENYRPITCLPVMWKLLTGIIAEYVYEFLDTENLLPDEQKGCRKNSQGTMDLL